MLMLIKMIMKLISQGEEEITVMLSTEKLRHWVTRRRWQRCSKVRIIMIVMMTKIMMMARMVNCDDNDKNDDIDGLTWSRWQG